MRHSLIQLSAVAVMALPTYASAAAPNLVSNCDFEAGAVSFESDYSYSPGGNGAEAQYTVRTNPYPWNGYFVSMDDHTTGTGQMFVGNGSPIDGAISVGVAKPHRLGRVAGGEELLRIEAAIPCSGEQADVVDDARARTGNDDIGLGVTGDVHAGDADWAHAGRAGARGRLKATIAVAEKDAGLVGIEAASDEIALPIAVDVGDGHT